MENEGGECEPAEKSFDRRSCGTIRFMANQTLVVPAVCYYNLQVSLSFTYL